LKISLDLIRSSLPARQAEHHAQLSEAILIADETMERIRLLAHNLRPPVLDTFGLSETLESFCDDFARRTGLTIHYEGVEPPSLSDTVKISFYRFLQETLNNAAKHAMADEMWVTLQHTMDMISLLVKDNGRGFIVEKELVPRPGAGVGLVGLQERFELLGGQVELSSAPGKGTEVMASVPLDVEKDEETG
jgi:two-component system sensor histidine kinase DegS